MRVVLSQFRVLVALAFITEVEWRGYHRLAAKGHMTDEELVAALVELDETRETAERELEAVRAWARHSGAWSTTGTP